MGIHLTWPLRSLPRRNNPFYQIEPCPYGIVGAMSMRECRIWVGIRRRGGVGGKGVPLYNMGPAPYIPRVPKSNPQPLPAATAPE